MDLTSHVHFLRFIYFLQKGATFLLFKANVGGELSTKCQLRARFLNARRYIISLKERVRQPCLMFLYHLELAII